MSCFSKRSNVKKNRIATLFIAAILALGAATMTSCAVVVVGAAAAGTVAYVRGSIRATLPYSVETLAKAVRTTITDDLKFALIKAGEDATGAEYVARNSQDEKIVITLSRIDDKVTKLEIRVGTFGDESTSRLILNRIERNLD